MKISPFLFLAALLVAPAGAAERLVVTVAHGLAAARPAETISVPWTEVAGRLPGAQPDSLVVRDAAGAALAYQFTNFQPDDVAGRYGDVLFQHDFAAGEARAVFTVERAPGPVPPWPAKVFARYVPERFDDFAFENDRLAHRVYGPALATPAAGRHRLTGSGLDLWAKRVRYPIIDRWYLRGHDAYHRDNGEGLDFYTVGTSRGLGGTGVWAAGRLHPSGNWSSWRVLANGPLRAVFELDYDAWDAGGVRVSERKRFTVDAGANFHRVETTLTFTGGPEVTLALGLAKAKAAGRELPAVVVNSPATGRLSRWTTYPKDAEGQLGTAVLLGAGAFAATTEDELNQLALVPVKSGQPFCYYVGAGWSRSGDFATAAEWDAAVAATAARLRSPVTISLSVAP
ncbi:MAG: DUF4861 family protein [Opitutae bacterium]|nr:DUF4861 family protein [Opitutae bacterium]